MRVVVGNPTSKNQTKRTMVDSQTKIWKESLGTRDESAFRKFSDSGDEELVKQMNDALILGNPVFYLQVKGDSLDVEGYKFKNEDPILPMRKLELQFKIQTSLRPITNRHVPSKRPLPSISSNSGSLVQSEGPSAVLQPPVRAASLNWVEKQMADVTD